MRYVKQIKVRNCENKYNSENVLVYEIIKEDGNCVKFRFIDYGEERDHLKPPSEIDAMVSKAVELKQQGKTQRQIADELKKSVSTVNNYLKKGEARIIPFEQPNSRTNEN